VKRYNMKQDKRDLYKLIEGTPDFTGFQRKVYKAVLEIPAGKVKSYKWVAFRIGMPRSYRAVGQALKKNPYTVMIPCHRVINSSGKLGGYSKGTRLKRSLLERESSSS